MDNTAWELNPAETGSLDVQCARLGGGVTPSGKSSWHAGEKLMSMDRHSVNKTIGMQKPAQLQAPPIPKNTYCCIMLYFQSGRIRRLK